LPSPTSIRVAQGASSVRSAADTDLESPICYEEQAAMTGPSAPETPVIRGTILAESIKPGSSFEGHGMRIISWARYDVSGTAEYQPPMWTAIEFEAPAHSSDALATDLSGVLLRPGWYANWNSNTETTIVFPGRIFRYLRGDKAGREEAQEFGRQCGVPEHQLDWTD
jgi:hypothetical protein